MTTATQELIDNLSKILDQNKYLILSGGTAIGKTYIATAVMENCALKRYNAQGLNNLALDKYDIKAEIVPIHPSYAYEDFVVGMSIRTVNGKVTFRYEDKIFLSMLKDANESWKKKEDKKYFLLLDDIGRGAISGILGDMLPLIEPHGQNQYYITSKDQSKICISPNVYIIATRSTLVDAMEQSNYAFLRHFYAYEMENDYRFISETPTKSFSDYDVTANAMYYRARKIVTSNLRHRYQMSERERSKYVIGHGLYKDKGTTLLVRYQVVPLLKQYVKDGILDRTAKISIDALQKLVSGKYSKDISLADNDRIHLHKTGITADTFLNEKTTHQPLVNLVSRIKEQGLLDDTDITDGIMFNPQVLIRKKAKIDKVEREFVAPGFLYVKKSERDNYTYGTTKDKNGKSKSPRFFYSSGKTDTITVDGTDFSIASEMQPGEYTRWYEDLDSGTEENERYSSSPNSIMFRILRSYYRALNQHYEEYLHDYPDDKNIENLRAYANEEYRILVSESRKLHPEISDEKEVNSKANDDFRNVIYNLTLLWKDKGDLITVGGQNITVEGVYKVNNSKKYEEYSKAMEALDIHQMILQGPPGTSKTYSAREFLKYMANDGDKILTDKELDALQIKDYTEGNPLSVWEESNAGSIPQIAWDIVQFHPSYGYEDFVRGIEVSTVKNETGESSSVSYDTVNKILGRMAETASRPQYIKTKFFLVIDEINRANLATVFGELIYGLEYRGRGVATPYTVENSNKIVLPDNLYIIGTMNTADKSIGGIDYAIRRRFLFFSLLPDREVIMNFKMDAYNSDDDKTRQIEVNQKAATLFDRISGLFNSDNLNTEYYKDDVQIGHTYFLVLSEEQLYLRFKYQILPILREYYKDGMESPDTDSDGWKGLLDCITGEMNINADDDKAKDIFEKLVKAS